MKNKEIQSTRRGVQEILDNKMNQYANKIVVSQYSGKKEQDREEGETWKDDEGRQWEMKNGIKQRISPLQSAKTPWWCPVCGKSMDKLDYKAWRVKAMCYNCVAKEETRMKIDGVWDDHAKKETLKSQISYLSDKIIELTYYHDTLSAPEFTTYDETTGKILMVDRYTMPVDKIKKDLMAEVVNMNKMLKEREAELASLLEENDVTED